MGSYALSQNTSSTAYSNAPIAQENVSNPVNLSNSNSARINSNDVKNDIRTQVSGGLTNNTLDAGAINRAFDFGGEAVKIIADLTKSNNQNLAAQSAGTVGLALAAQGSLDKNANGAANSDIFQNKFLIVGAALVAVAYLYFRK